MYSYLKNITGYRLCYINYPRLSKLYCKLFKHNFDAWQGRHRICSRCNKYKNREGYSSDEGLLQLVYKEINRG